MQIFSTNVLGFEHFSLLHFENLDYKLLNVPLSHQVLDTLQKTLNEMIVAIFGGVRIHPLEINKGVLWDLIAPPFIHIFFYKKPLYKKVRLKNQQK